MRAQGAPAETAEAARLGGLVVELRRGSPGVSGILAAVGGGLVLYSAYFTISDQLLWLLLGIFGFPIFATGLWGLRHRIRIFEHGVEVWGFFDRATLLYEEAESLTFSLVNMRVQGVPTGLHAHLVLRGARRRLFFSTRVSGNAREQLDVVRERTTHEIARKSWERLRRGEPFEWGRSGPRVKLQAEGLSFRPERFIGHGSAVVVPYSPAFNHQLAGGVFALYLEGKKLFELKSEEPNFYPGLAMFEHLVRGAAV